MELCCYIDIWNYWIISLGSGNPYAPRLSRIPIQSYFLGQEWSLREYYKQVDIRQIHLDKAHSHSTPVSCCTLHIFQNTFNQCFLAAIHGFWICFFHAKQALQPRNRIQMSSVGTGVFIVHILIGSGETFQLSWTVVWWCSWKSNSAIDVTYRQGLSGYIEVMYVLDQWKNSDIRPSMSDMLLHPWKSPCKKSSNILTNSLLPQPFSICHWFDCTWVFEFRSAPRSPCLWRSSCESGVSTNCEVAWPWLGQGQVLFMVMEDLNVAVDSFVDKRWSVRLDNSSMRSRARLDSAQYSPILLRMFCEVLKSPTSSSTRHFVAVAGTFQMQ